MKTIDDVLNRLTSVETIMLVRPATDQAIKRCNQCFAEYEMDMTIPDQYADFLSKHNGFAWNGIEFYSTGQVTYTPTNYTLNDIVSANEYFAEHYGESGHCLLLGRADDNLYVHNTKNGKYEILDISGSDAWKKYDTFEAMFIGVVAPRL
jgi:hypothetical protein